MKKIKYYERSRNEKGHTIFLEYDGYLEQYLTDGKDLYKSKIIKIVYRRCENGLWKVTHYDSGLAIDYGLPTKNKAVESVKKRFEAVLKRIQDKDVQTCMYELTEYKNSLIEGLYK